MCNVYATVGEVCGVSCVVDVVDDPAWGRVFRVTARTSASRALQMWLEVQRRCPGVPLVFRWTGVTDVSRDELIAMLLGIADAGGLKTSSPGFNSAETVAEGRDR